MTANKPHFGVAQGRFQIVHHGHMEYLLEAKRRCDFLLVGVSDHDPERSYFDVTQFGFSPQSAQPFRILGEPHHTFTYFERARMLQEALLGEGIAASEFAITPFPIHHPHLLRYYVPMGATMFVTIYEAWGHQKAALLKSLGYEVEILWERDLSDRFTTGTEVRRLIAEGGDWQNLVPVGVAKVIKEIGLDRIIRKLTIPES